MALSDLIGSYQNYLVPSATRTQLVDLVVQLEGWWMLSSRGMETGGRHSWTACPPNVTSYAKSPHRMRSRWKSFPDHPWCWYIYLHLPHKWPSFVGIKSPKHGPLWWVPKLSFLYTPYIPLIYPLYNLIRLHTYSNILSHIFPTQSNMQTSHLDRR